MTPRDFVLWLEGYMVGKIILNSADILIIESNLMTVDKTDYVPQVSYNPLSPLPQKTERVVYTAGVCTPGPYTGIYGEMKTLEVSNVKVSSQLAWSYIKGDSV